jgi:hypothetical protein
MTNVGPNENWVDKVPPATRFIVDISPDEAGTGLLIESSFDPDPPEDAPVLEMMMMVTAFLMRTCAQQSPLGPKLCLDHLRNMVDNPEGDDKPIILRP